jgi:predicted transcriptional regulator
MTTTTLRLPDDLKARVTAAAEANGQSAHGFMVRAIESVTAEAEEQAAFEALARERLDEFDRTGEHYTLDDLRTYTLARARGEAVQVPVPRKLPPEELARRQRRRAG